MIFIGGISQGQKILDYVKTVICDRCGGYGRYQVYMTYMYFSFFFIPLFKWNKRFYIPGIILRTLSPISRCAGKIIGQAGELLQRQCFPPDRSRNTQALNGSRYLLLCIRNLRRVI